MSTPPGVPCPGNACAGLRSSVDAGARSSRSSNARERIGVFIDRARGGCRPSPLRRTIIPRPEEPPPPKQLALFIPHGPLELSAMTTLLESQLRSTAPRRLSWMTLLARVFRIDISVCPRCAGPMRVTGAVTTPEQIAAELRGARPPRAPSLPDSCSWSRSPDERLAQRHRAALPARCPPGSAPRLHPPPFSLLPAIPRKPCSTGASGTRACLQHNPHSPRDTPHAPFATRPSL